MATGSSGARKFDDTHTKTERFTAVKRSVFIFIPAAKKPVPAQRQPVTLSPIFTLIALLYFPTTRIMEGLPDFPRKRAGRRQSAYHCRLNPRGTGLH